MARFKTYFSPSKDSKYTHNYLCDVLREVIVEAQELGLDLLPIDDTMYYINSKVVLGMCVVQIRNNKATKPCEIYLSHDVLQGSDTFIRQIIAHEVCHAVRYSKHHDTLWLRAANKMNKAYGYNITAKDDTGTQVIKSRYLIKCKNCNNEYRHSRMCASIEYPQEYVCSKCNMEDTLEAYELNTITGKYEPCNVSKYGVKVTNKYIVKCTSCGFSKGYHRNVKILEAVRQNRCYCPYCGTLDLVVNVNGSRG